MNQTLRNVFWGGMIAGTTLLPGCQKPASENSSQHTTPITQQPDSAQIVAGQQLAARRANVAAIRTMFLNEHPPAHPMAEAVATLQGCSAILGENQEASLNGLPGIDGLDADKQIMLGFQHQNRNYRVSSGQMGELVRARQEFARKIPAASRVKGGQHWLNITNDDEDTHYKRRKDDQADGVFLSARDLCRYSFKATRAIVAHETAHGDDAKILPERYDRPEFQRDPALRLATYNEFHADSLGARWVGAKNMIALFLEMAAVKLADTRQNHSLSPAQKEFALKWCVGAGIVPNKKHPAFGRRIEYMQQFLDDRPDSLIVMPDALDPPAP